ncbi:phosphodiester glycosidase family protein [Acinetobacter guillouiae]|uniref:phosphodiester glycosidase family protein n=1 Tax=Acinetobacter guillouiae TaxID=106649 RepID=UPI0032B32FB1
MNLKTGVYALISMMGLSALSFQVNANTDYIKIIKDKKVIADAVRIDDLDQLQLFLKNQQGQTYKKFATLQKERKKCQISFAMNAGMYHPNFAPVGLYIEQGKQQIELNQQKNKFGNFFMQPNGVVTWNNKQAVIKTTEQYLKSNFKARYATQSGPMLLINGEINPIFVKNSDSLKVRNGVGIKNNQLYFVISRGKINFYNFADILKSQLKTDQALYLDGSISSAFIPQVKRNDQTYDLGPMFIYSETKNCDD